MWNVIAHLISQDKLGNYDKVYFSNSEMILFTDPKKMTQHNNYGYLGGVIPIPISH